MEGTGGGGSCGGFDGPADTSVGGCTIAEGVTAVGSTDIGVGAAAGVVALVLVRVCFGDAAVPLSRSFFILSRSLSLSRATASTYSPTSAATDRKSLDLERVKARKE